MPLFLADLHSHVDYYPETNNWHGERPHVFAQQIVHGTRLDIIAITEHNAVTDRYFDTAEEIERLLALENARTDCHRQITTLLGAELTVMFGAHRYHVGYIYEERFQRGGLPDVPPLRCNVKDLEHYSIDYPGIRILNHPTWKDRGAIDNAVTGDFIRSGLVDGVEIANGCMLYHGKHEGAATREACRMFMETKSENRACFAPRLAAIGSSDAHRAPMLAAAATAFRGEDHGALFRAVRSGRTQAVGIEPTLVRPRLADIRASITGLDAFIRLLGESLDGESSV